MGGKHRGRRLEAPLDDAIRPTSDRVREAVFNVLAHAPFAIGALRSSAALDAFCGTGAMGLEALSRGVGSCIFLDTSLAALKLAERNAVACGESARARFLLTDPTNPPRPPASVSLAFLDPPYASALAAPALVALATGGWFARRALCVVETGAGFALPAGFAPLDERRYGRARIAFLRWDRPAQAP